MASFILGFTYKYEKYEGKKSRYYVGNVIHGKKKYSSVRIKAEKCMDIGFSEKIVVVKTVCAIAGFV